MYMPWPSDALDGIRDKHIYPLVSCFIFSVVFRLVYNYYRRHCTGERGAEKSGTPATCGDEQHLEDGVLQPNARLDMESDPQGTESFSSALQSQLPSTSPPSSRLAHAPPPLLLSPSPSSSLPSTPSSSDSPRIHDNDGQTAPIQRQHSSDNVSEILAEIESAIAGHLRIMWENTYDGTITRACYEGVDLEARDWDDNTALLSHLCSYPESPYTGWVKFLLSLGANVNAANKRGDTALHLAIKNRRGYRNVELLLRHGADVNAVNNAGETPLLLEVDYDAAEPWEETQYEEMEYGDEYEGDDEDDIRARQELLKDDGTILARLLLDHGAKLNVADQTGTSPLQAAVMVPVMEPKKRPTGSRREALVKLFLSRDADPNIYTKSKGYLEPYEPLAEAIVYHRKFYSPGHEIDDKVPQMLLDAGANICGHAGPGGWTMLHTACSRGYTDKNDPKTFIGYCDPKLVQLFLDAGADVNGCHNCGETPLFSAAQSGQPEVVKVLLEAGAKVNITDSMFCQTPLYNAVFHSLADSVEKRLEVIRLLHSYGASFEYPCDSGEEQYFIHCCGNSGKWAAERELAIQLGADINIGDKYRYTLLHKAETAEEAAWLISHGADIEAETYDGSPPLKTIVDRAEASDECEPFDAAPVIRVLIDAGADVNGSDGDGNTALHCARTTRTAELLLEAGADANAAGADGDTPLSDAALYNSPRVAELLMAAGGRLNPDYPASDYIKRPLNHAAVHDDVETARVWIQAGRTLDEWPGSICTPLHTAAKHNAAKVARALVDAGAQPAWTDEEGATPLHYAAGVEVAEFLIAHDGGASLKVKDNAGRTPLDTATERKNSELCRFLRECMTEQGEPDLVGVVDELEDSKR